MATLTWRNVDAPDFRTSLEGYNTFSRLLGDAFKGASQGIDTFDNALNERANTAVIAAAMRERDPEAYQAALASGQFIEGIDPKRVSAQTYAALNNQASSLLNQATQSQQLGDMRYASNQGKAFDALGPEAQRIEQLRRLNTPEATAEADQLMASLRPQLAAAGTRNTLGLTKSFNDAELFGVDIAGRRQEQTLAANRDRRDETRLGYEGERVGFERSRLNMDQGRYNWEISDRNDVKAGQAAFMAMQGRSMDRETALSAFSSPEFAGLTPGAKMYALQQLNSSWGNIYSQDQLGAAAGFTPSGSGPAGLVNSESGGNWSALNSEGYGGRLQFGDARLADAAKAGLVPKGTTGAQFSKMSPAQQQKVENWHFQDVDNQANSLGVSRYIGQNVGGVPITRDSIRAMAHLGGVTGVKKFVESGGRYNPADSNGTKLSDYGRRFAGSLGEGLIDAGTAARTGVQQRLAQNETNTTIPNWATSVQDRRDPIEIANELANGPLKGLGENANQIAYRIQQIQKKTGGTNAEAADILRKSIDVAPASRGVMGDIANMFVPRTGSLPSNLKPTVNQKRIDALTQSAGDGSTRGQVLESERLKQLNGQINAAQQNAARASQLLAEAQRRAAVDPAAKGLVRKYQIDQNAANARLRSLLQSSVDKDSKAKTPTKVDPKSRTKVLDLPGDWLDLWK